MRRLRREAKKEITIKAVNRDRGLQYRVGTRIFFSPICIPTLNDAEFYTHIQDAKWALYKRRRQYVIYLLREIKAKKAKSKIKKIMTIETKYNIGDKVWTSFGEIPMLCEIKGIEEIEVEGFLMVVYSVFAQNESIFGSRFLGELFPTKEELLKSL